MIAIKNITNPWLVLFLSLISIFLIGIGDYYTGFEISFSVFYLIPVSFFALYRNVGKVQIIINCFFAGIIWFLAEYYSNSTYSHYLIPFWNGLVRLSIFVFISFILFNLKIKHKVATNYLQKLRALTSEKNKLVEAIAYDINTPITFIKSYTELLMSDASFQKMSGYDQDITRQIFVASNNALNEIKRLLEISIIEENQLQLKAESHNYFSFIEKVQTSFNSQARKKNVTISINSNDKDKSLFFDYILMEDAIENILTYILNISSLGETIYIHIRQKDNILATSIQTKGKTIPFEQLSCLFDLKTNSEKINPSEKKGILRAEIGLIIAKKIVSAHKGSIAAKSDNTVGTSIEFNLPC